MGGSQAEFGESAQAMYERMVAWRHGHPEASFDAIAEAVGRERRELMGQLLSELACQNQRAVEPLSTECPSCAGPTEGKGHKARGISHMEGKTKLERGIATAASAAGAFFPLDEQLKLSTKSWRPEIIRNAVRLGD